MKLLEYQAKALMEKCGIPTMKGAVVSRAEEAADKIAAAGLQYPVVVKAQVQIGGRGKAGGVQFANNAAEAEAMCRKILGMDIRGYTVNEVMIVEKFTVATEWYCSIMLDRLSKSPLLIFSPSGGMDIEETSRTSPEKIAKIPIDYSRGVESWTIDYAMDKTGAACQGTVKEQFRSLVEKLLKMFYSYYTMLVEINPLGIDNNGNLVALDAKVEIDDNALDRLPDVLPWRDKLQEEAAVVEARKFKFHLVPMDADGEIAIMSNGSGMMMSCIDLISQKGMKIGAALDLGGGATADRIKEAVRIMFSVKGIDTVFICIFGGITRCDEVAKGAVMSMQHGDAHGKKMVLRLEGTNKEEAKQIVADSKLPITVAEGIPNSIAAIHQMKGGK
jgi:succinyl-CoA synthetase beta subunit